MPSRDQLPDESMKAEDHLNRAEHAKLITILNMAFDFTSMSRVFEKGTKDKFIEKVQELISKLAVVTSAEEFDNLHDGFCRWGCYVA